MKISKILYTLTAFALVLLSVHSSTQTIQRNKNKTCARCATCPRAQNPTTLTCPVDPEPTCKNYCPLAERAADQRISFWQDPLLSREREDEYEHYKKLCRQQNPGYNFTEERALAQQEMNEVD